MKRLVGFLAVLLLLSVCTSCIHIKTVKETVPEESTLPEGAVPVYSVYPYLTHLIPGDYESVERKNSFPPFKFVGVLDGRLTVYTQNYINVAENDPLTVEQKTEFSYGGLRGSMEGVYFYSEESGCWEKILNEHCRCIIGFGDRALVFTIGGPGYQILVRALFWEENGYRLTEPLYFQGDMYRFACSWNYGNEEGAMTIYAMSQINLTEIRVEDFWEMDETLSNVSIRQIEIPEWWKDRNRTVLLNMVLMEDGSLYVGERYGVIGVRDGKITYYPIDHNAALYGEKKN